MSWIVTVMLIVFRSGGPGGLMLAVTVTVIVGLSRWCRVSIHPLCNCDQSRVYTQIDKEHLIF